MSYTSLLVFACVFPAWVIIGVFIGLFNVIKNLASYHAGGFRFKEMLMTISLYAFIWPLLMIPDKQYDEREKWMNETEMQEMNARWLLLRMSEGETVFSLAKRTGKPVSTMKSWIFNCAVQIRNDKKEEEQEELIFGKRSTIIE